jgi:hypothetical protein
MARFHGRVGFGEATETKPGVFADAIVEHVFYGDIVQNRRNLQQGENLNQDLSVSNSISIVAMLTHVSISSPFVTWNGRGSFGL